MVAHALRPRHTRTKGDSTRLPHRHMCTNGDAAHLSQRRMCTNGNAARLPNRRMCTYGNAAPSHTAVCAQTASRRALSPSYVHIWPLPRSVLAVCEQTATPRTSATAVCAQTATPRTSATALCAQTATPRTSPTALCAQTAPPRTSPTAVCAQMATRRTATPALWTAHRTAQPPRATPTRTPLVWIRDQRALLKRPRLSRARAMRSCSTALRRGCSTLTAGTGAERAPPSR